MLMKPMMGFDKVEKAEVQAFYSIYNSDVGDGEKVNLGKS